MWRARCRNASRPARAGAPKPDMSGVNIANIFIATAQRWAAKPAVESAEISLTYEALLHRVNKTARHMRALGISDGNRVGIALSSGLDSYVSMFAIWMLNAVPVPMDFRIAAEERRRIASSLDLDFILDARLSEENHGFTSILVNEDWQEAVGKYSTDIVLPQPARYPAILSLTSGTTGAPQAIRVEHDTLIHRHSMNLVEGPVYRDLRYLNPLAVSNPTARSFTITFLLSGGTVIFFPLLFSPAELIEEMQSRGATYTILPPVVIRSLLDIARDRKQPVFPDLKYLRCGGAPTSSEEKKLARELLSPNFAVNYGTSTTGPVAVQFGGEFDSHPDSVGRPLPSVFVQIVDGAGELLPHGETGEIRVRSPGCVTEILDGSATGGNVAGDRISDGWVYPGDLGSMSEDGYLTLRGRSSELIIHGGVNVYPAEVEAVLNACEDVAESAVVGAPSKTHGEDVVAFVVGGGATDMRKLVAHCRTRLTPDKRPRHFYFVDSLPRNSNGKVRRKELLSRLQEMDVGEA